MRPTIWKITVLVETDDYAILDSKLDAIKEALCGPEDMLGPEHRCDPPWYMITTSMTKKKAKRWRDLLNR